MEEKAVKLANSPTLNTLMGKASVAVNDLQEAKQIEYHARQKLHEVAADLILAIAQNRSDLQDAVGSGLIQINWRNLRRFERGEGKIRRY
jgi:hypothetical protein